MRSRARRSKEKVGFAFRKRQRSLIYSHPIERLKEIEINSELKDYISENRQDSETR
jgi:hypothetical protein